MFCDPNPTETLTMTIFVIVLIVAVALLVYVATRPDTFRIERNATINAPADKIFGLLSDFHRWELWSPWEKLDPNLKRTHSGTAAGRGAAYAWEGNKKVGSGRMEITEATPPSRLVIKLDFLKPFEAHNTTEFTLKPAGSGTHLTWAMTGSNSFMGKLMGLMMNMDTAIGKDFEAGLANLKAVAER
jgi:uncharacterized protein YndB with AHSA1/START domain